MKEPMLMSQKEISMLRQRRQTCLLKNIGLEKDSGSLLRWMEKKSSVLMYLL